MGLGERMKKVIIAIVSVVVLLGIAGGVFYFLNKEDSDSTLTILEKQWIEDNKNTIQDFSIVNKLPIFTYDGEGVIYDFLADLEEKTGLEFNKLTYKDGDDIPSTYAFTIKDKAAENDILVYQDNYVLLGKNNLKYLKLESISDKTIGVLETDLDKAKLFLDNDTLTFITYDSVDELITEYSHDTTKLDFIALPKTLYLNEIITSGYYINYNITEMTKDYVITLGDNSKLNNILTKYFNKWHDLSYDETYHKYFADSYFAFNNITSDEEANFQGKQYRYGFVNNEPYDSLINNKLIGINDEIISSFATASGIEVTYHEYKNNQKLVEAFNDGKIDFFLNVTSDDAFKVDSYQSVDIFDSETVVLALDNNVSINSLNSLINQKVAGLDMSKITDYLKSKSIEVKTYKDINELVSKVSDDTLLVLDKRIYEIYKNNTLKDYNVHYSFDLNRQYNYVINIKDNKLFSNYYDFYLSFMNEKQFINKISYNDFKVEKDYKVLKNVIYILLAVLTLLIITVVIKAVKAKKVKKQGITKENKLKYIDMLTSLKNRNYLNDHIEEWDDSGVYPQTIMIVDLNNVAYINDNYGHEEGDNVITEAANILIKNQVEQTEIIRTSGNEFLIYLVGYDEKQIVAYKRKLIKEFKELAHGFGAAVGYSMILDGLKTIDDAINEAALDMRANKEETE